MHSIIVVMKLVEGPQIIIISFLKPSSSDSICESFIVTISKKLRLEFLSSTFILPAYKRKRINPTMPALTMARIPVIPSSA